MPSANTLMKIFLYNNFQRQQVGLFNTLRLVMRELIEWRKQLICGTLTQDQIRELKAKTIAKIDWGNR